VKPIDIQKSLPPGASVLDVGCYDFKQWQLSQALHRGDLHHSGVDYCQPDSCPAGFVFRLADLNRARIPFDDDSFDLVVASHVIEHLEKPVDFFADCVRVCKPGGKLYLECPSERTLMLPGFPFDHDKLYSTSFFDDPTHLGRPFSPQSFVRLAAYHGCKSVCADYDISWGCRLLFPLAVPFALIFRKGWLLEHVIWKSVGWASYSVVEKPRDLRGKPSLNYFLPQNRYDDWLLRSILKIRHWVSSGK
jgi:SAM-dependent methyltransferase